MCEVGAWKNTEELEDSLILDELIDLFEKTNERQTRLLKTVAAAFGASSDDSTGDGRLEYTQGEIASGGSTLFGYRTKEVSGEE